MTPHWQPYREHLWVTMKRNGAIALIAGGILGATRAGRLGWMTAVLVALWPSFGGHWIEVLFLNGLRPRLSPARGVQIAARLATWFAGGVVLTFGARLTAGSQRPAWWIGGLIFIAIELVAHVSLVMPGRPSFYNGRG